MIPPEKLPWLKFWVGDWRGDNNLRLCSLQARGLWIELLCVMHDSDPYGQLVVDGKAMKVDDIAVLVGAAVEIVEPLLAELERRKVFSRDDKGVIVCRRMLRDDHIRKVRADAGSRGGKKTAKKKS